MLKEGQARALEKLNIHHLINRIDKLESLVSTLVFNSMQGDPKRIKVILEQHKKPLIFQTTIFDKENEGLLESAMLEREQIDGPL